MDNNIFNINPNECVTRDKRDQLADNLLRLSRKLAYYESLVQRRDNAGKYNASWEAFKCVSSCIILVFFANLLIVLTGLVPEEIYSILANASLVIGAIYCVFGVISCYSIVDKNNFVSNNSNRILNSQRCFSLYNHIHSFFDDGFATSESAKQYADFIKSGQCSSIDEAREHLRFVNRYSHEKIQPQQIGLNLCRN